MSNISMAIVDITSTMARISRVPRYFALMPGVLGWIRGRCLNQMLLFVNEVATVIQHFIRGKLARIHADKMRKEAKLRNEAIEG
jgi:hypothetical protein